MQAQAIGVALRFLIKFNSYEKKNKKKSKLGGRKR
jgi:hypothetical protein